MMALSGRIEIKKDKTGRITLVKGNPQKKILKKDFKEGVSLVSQPGKTFSYDDKFKLVDSGSDFDFEFDSVSDFDSVDFDSVSGSDSDNTNDVVDHHLAENILINAAKSIR
jgi:hypothetical protein